MSISSLFLDVLRASLKNETIQLNNELSVEEWVELFRIADKHQVLPLIYETVVVSTDAKQNEELAGLLAQLRMRIIQQVMLQTQKTMAFSQLYRHLNRQEIYPIVVKGIICRNLYVKPDHRLSNDEDLLIAPELFTKCHETMLDFGMVLGDPESDIEADFEVPYGKPGSPLAIELHKSLFPPDSEAYGDFNRYFAQAAESAVSVEIEGTSYRTLSHSDHLFYLICHAFKHFLHSGFGIRQVCDIILYANTYGREVDWAAMLQKCSEIHADKFTAALFQIGEKYLVFDPKQACYPAAWREIKVDETMLLEDLLDAGIFGDGSMSRKHSSNMTLNAVAADKNGKKPSSGVMASLFPSASALEGRYPYLKEKPYLLPVAWGDRILKYRKETAGRGEQNSAGESIKIGERRVQMLKEYGIIQ